MRDSLQLIGLGAVVASVVLTIAAAIQWFGYWTPAALYMVAAAALCGGIAYGYAQSDRPKTLAIGLGICVLAGLPVFGWMAAPARALVVELAQDKLPESSLARALEDDAEQVRLRSCVAVGLDGNERLRRQAVVSLMQTPAALAECIEQVRQADPISANGLARQSVRYWQSAVDQGVAQTACAAAPKLFSIDPQQTNEPARRLTTCAMNAESAQLAQCCAEALTAQFDSAKAYTAALGAPDKIAEDQRLMLFSPLVSHAFPKTSQPRHKLASLEQRLLKKPEVQAWTVGLGCTGLFGEDDPAAAFQEGLLAVAESQGCGVEPLLGAGDATNMWREVCVGLSDTGVRDSGMCKAIDDAGVARTIAIASVRLLAALETRKARSMTRSIERGDRLRRSYTEGKEGQLRAFTESMNPQNNLGLDSRARRTMREVYAGSKQANEAVQNLLKEEREREESGKPEVTYEDIKPYLTQGQKSQIKQQRQQHADEADKFKGWTLSDFDGAK